MRIDREGTALLFVAYKTQGNLKDPTVAATKHYMKRHHKQTSSDVKEALKFVINYA